MASLFRRKRSLIFKLLLGIPTLWLIIVIFLSFQNTEENKPSQVHKPVVDSVIKREAEHPRMFNGFQNPINRINEMVQPFNPFAEAKKPAEKQEDSKPKFSDNNIAKLNPPDAERVIPKDYDDSLKYLKDPNAPGEIT